MIPPPPPPPPPLPPAPEPQALPVAPHAQPNMPPPLPTTPRNPENAAYLRAIFSPHGWTTVAWIAGSVLAVGVLSALCLLGALGIVGSESGGALSLDFGGMLSALLVLIGASFGGGLVLEGNVGAGLFEASGNASATLFPLTTLALIAAGAAIVARARTRFESVPAPGTAVELARAAIEGAAVAVALAIISAFAMFGGSSALGGMYLRTRPGVVLFTLFAVVTISLFLSRESERRRLSARSRSAWSQALRETGSVFVVQGTVFGVCALVLVVTLALQAESLGVLFASLPFLGNVAVISAALGHFGGIALGTNGGVGQTVMAWDVPGGIGMWLFVAAFVCLVGAAGAVGVRRQRTDRINWRRIWQLPTIVFGIWCAVSLGLVGVTLSGELSSFSGMFGVGGVGLSWSTPFVMGLASAILSIIAELVPLWAYRMNPGLLRLLGGRKIADAWIRGTEPTAAQDSLNTPDHDVSEIPQPDAVTHATAIPVVDPPDIAPMSKRGKTGLLVGLSVVGLCAVLGGGIAITVAVLNQGRDPGAPVREYLGALESGDADRASELVDPGLKTTDRELLTNEVLAGATHRIEVVDVETTNRSAEGASVRATYAIDGERFEQEFSVTAGAKEFLFLDTWTLKEPLLVETELSGEALETLTVGPTEITLTTEDEAWEGALFSRTAYLYPGIYEVTAPEDTYLSTSTEELRALPASLEESASITVTSKPSEALEKAVLKQVQSRVNKCVEIPTNMDEVCPYVTQDKDLAELKVVKQATSFQEITLENFRTSEMEIAVRSNPSGWNKDPDLEEWSFSVSGSIEFVEGKPKVTDLSMGW